MFPRRRNERPNLSVADGWPGLMSSEAWTVIRLLALPGGKPAVSTNRSPRRSKPRPTRIRRTARTTASKAPKSLTKAGSTPQVRHRLCTVDGWWLNARTGTFGLSRATNRGVAPRAVGVTIARAPTSRATRTAASLTDPATNPAGCARWANTSGSSVASARRAIRAIVSTTFAGWRPIAVSSESITASVPSRMALATSPASARVGCGASTMLLSICVAVMTGFALALASRMIRF